MLSTTGEETIFDGIVPANGLWGNRVAGPARGCLSAPDLAAVTPKLVEAHLLHEALCERHL